VNSGTYHMGRGLASVRCILLSNSQPCVNEVNETKFVSSPLRRALEYGTWDPRSERSVLSAYVDVYRWLAELTGRLTKSHE
jgi:hypothetical protein